MINVDPENPLLILYRAGKRFMGLIDKLFGSIYQEKIDREIEATLREDADFDICRLMRFVFLWLPLTCLFVLLVVVELGVILSMTLSQVTNPDPFVTEFFEDFVLQVLVFSVVVTALLFGGIALAAKMTPEPLKQAVSDQAGRAIAPVKEALPVIRAWAEAKHQKFCFKLKIAKPMIP